MRINAFEIIEPVPQLNKPTAIALLRPWIDVGKVGTLVLSRLEQHLGAKELGRLARPGTFFDFTRYRPRTRLVNGRRVLTTPNTIVRYGRDMETERDYLFLHVREPHAMGEDYTDAIVSLLNHFDVSEYCRVGGMYDSVPHTRPLLVTGSLSDAQTSQTKGLVSPSKSTYQGPTSIVNLVTDQMDAARVQLSSLMVHLPQYVQLDEDHMGATRLMQALCAMYGFPNTLADSNRGQRQYVDINRAVENNAEVKTLITQLETYYDKVLSTSESAEEADEDSPSLAPNVEDFLREVGQRLEEDEAEDDSEEETEEDGR